ncbi:MAG: hypothetical protein WKF95_16125 [Rubrobacter sp.]
MTQRFDLGPTPDPAAVEAVHYRGHGGKAPDGAKDRPADHAPRIPPHPTEGGAGLPAPRAPYLLHLPHPSAPRARPSSPRDPPPSSIDDTSVSSFTLATTSLWRP